MSDQGKKLGQMMKSLSDAERLAKEGINVESLKKSIKQKQDDCIEGVSK
ncbi:MAG: hypothetical protein AAF348_07530 [Bacteroidota bacterium]